MRSAPAAGRAFSPLDEELGLVPGTLTPTLAESVTRLGTEVPSFERAARLLAHFTGVPLDAATVRRRTEAAGAAYVAVQAATVEQLERDLPPAPAEPELLQVSVDGAHVPLLNGEWAEVKTLAIGEVVGPADTESGVKATALSYFSRLADHETFRRAAWGELHRRGVPTAARVAGVVDGSDWCQGFFDYHRPDAARILDFPHGLEHLATAAQASFGAGPAATIWLAEQAHTLKHDDPADALAALCTLPVAQARDPAAATQAREATLEYLAKRWAQIQYAAFREAGYPIGSGIVESANKLVVEARLKGSGMHWARDHVDPLVALRTVACADRWAEAWPTIEARLRQHAAARTAARRAARRAAAAPVPPVPATESAALPARRPAPHPSASAPTAPVPKGGDGRPTEHHPWRRFGAFARRSS